MKSHHNRLSPLALTIALGIFIPLLVYLLVTFNIIAASLWFITGKLKDNGSYFVYLPGNLERGKRHPLVFALSPTADALSMLSMWSSVAEKHKWIVAASKVFHNDLEFGPLLQEIEVELNDVEDKYSIDTNRVIFTGISGGGMGAHAFSKFYPDRVSAVVVNTGMMEAAFMTGDYPSGKLAVFLASPTDFRFDEMQRDRNFLQTHLWRTKWIEFAGGHTMAPAVVYDQAADWLEENLR